MAGWCKAQNAAACGVLATWVFQKGIGVRVCVCVCVRVCVCVPSCLLGSIAFIGVGTCVQPALCGKLIDFSTHIGIVQRAMAELHCQCGKQSELQSFVHCNVVAVTLVI